MKWVIYSHIELREHMEFIALIVTIMTTPCGVEDGKNCYWDAQAMGNGRGVSFIDVNGNAFYKTEVTE